VVLAAPLAASCGISLLLGSLMLPLVKGLVSYSSALWVGTHAAAERDSHFGQQSAHTTSTTRCRAVWGACCAQRFVAFASSAVGRLTLLADSIPITKSNANTSTCGIAMPSRARDHHPARLTGSAMLLSTTPVSMIAWLVD
jgi:hypothetical protein